MKIDRNIRFVGIVNSKGEVIEGGFQEGTAPLLTEQDEQEMYAQSLLNISLLKDYSDTLGKIKYNLSEYERIALMTFPLQDGILCISTSSKASINKVKDKTLEIISVNKDQKQNNKSNKGKKGIDQKERKGKVQEN